MPPPDGPDDAADTQMFRAFVEREDEPAHPQRPGAGFRLVTLAAGLLLFAGLVWLLLQL